MYIKISYAISADEKKSQIHAVSWKPDDGNAVATMQLVHGMVEYIERYEEFARYLTERGFAVYGHDHIGHGDSVKDQSQLGIMYARHPDEVMINDMMTTYSIIKKEHPDKPHFLLGHSMGSFLSRQYISLHGSELAGAVIMGTGGQPSGTLNMGKMVCSRRRYLKNV